MRHSRLPILAITAALLASATVAPAATTFIQGIDVYNGQGSINWTSVKNGAYDFAFVKATEGVDFMDARFNTNITNANAAGLYVGPYHFARVDSYNGVQWGSVYDGQALSPTSPNLVNRNGYADATSEAADFLDAIRPYYHQTGNTRFLRPVADVERFPNFSNNTTLNRTFVSNWVQLFSDAVLAELGVRPIIYTNLSSANTYYTSAVASAHPLWLAWWRGTGTTNPPVQSNSPLWPAWSFWQWSDGTDSTAQASPVPSISSTFVDRDVFSGTLADLANFRVQIAAGDADFNNRIDADDYFRIDVGYAKRLTTWSNGDFNYNGIINGDDYAIIDAAFMAQSAPAAVPEPTGVALLLLSATAASLARRRRRGLAPFPVFVAKRA
jgi:lysozyme